MNPHVRVTGVELTKGNEALFLQTFTRFPLPALRPESRTGAPIVYFNGSAVTPQKTVLLAARLNTPRGVAAVSNRAGQAR